MGQTKELKPGKGMIIAGGIIDLIYGVLVLLASVILKKEAGSTGGSFNAYGETNVMSNEYFAKAIGILGAIVLATAVLTLVFCAMRRSGFAIAGLIVCGIVSLISPIPAILILVGTSREAKINATQKGKANMGGAIVTFVLVLFGLASLFMLFRLNGRGEGNVIKGNAVSYFSKIIGSQNAQNYKETLVTVYTFLMLAVAPILIDLFLSMACISNPLNLLDKKKTVKTVNMLSWGLFVVMYALYIWKLVTAKIPDASAGSDTNAGLISSMALSILPLLLLYVSPVLFFVCAKCLLKCARMLPIAAFGGRLFKGKVRFAKFLSYLLLLISLPVSYLYAYAVAVLASMALASVVLWIVVYGFCSLAFGKDSVKLSSSDGNVRILLEKDWCGNYSAEVSEKGEKTKTYYSEDGKTFR